MSKVTQTRKARTPPRRHSWRWRCRHTLRLWAGSRPGVRVDLVVGRPALMTLEVNGAFCVGSCSLDWTEKAWAEVVWTGQEAIGTEEAP